MMHILPDVLSEGIAGSLYKTTDTDWSVVTIVRALLLSG